MKACRIVPCAAAALFVWLSAVATFAETVSSEKHDFRLVSVAEGLAHPWGLAFLPNGDLLVTEREGRLRVIREGRLDPTPVAGLPDISAGGQGGLLDVAVHPDFENNRFVYLSFAAESFFMRGTEVARARFVDGRLEDLETILAVTPKSTGGRHFALSPRLRGRRQPLRHLRRPRRG